MSDENKNPSEAEETTPEEVLTAETTDLPDEAVILEQEEPDDDQSTQDSVTDADGWTTVSLPSEVTDFGWASYWNIWRKSVGKKIRLNDPGKEHLRQLSSLRGFDLSGMDLSGYELNGKDLVQANFTRSLLKGTIFTGSDLRRANFNHADLTGADFSDTRLSGAVLDEETRFEDIKSNSQVAVGINGIYVRRSSRPMGEESESAALMTMIPAGDSMRGHGSDAVLETLKHAHKLNNASILGVAIMSTILCFPVTVSKLQLPFVELELNLPIGILSILVQITVLVCRLQVLYSIREVADAAKYFRTREDVMKICSYPWAISRYSRRRPDIVFNEKILKTFNDWWPHFLGELTRAVTVFHPMLFLVGGTSYLHQHREQYGSISPLLFKPAIFLLLLVFLVIFSWLLYRESRRFSRPIIFDAEAEKAPRSDLASLAESVAEQMKLTKRLVSFIETAVPRYANLGDRLSDRLPDGVEIAMRRIPAGRYEMGSYKDDHEKPLHEVALQEFWMAEHTVTQRLWVAVMKSLPNLLTDSKFINPRYPVIVVSWEDAVRFSQKLNDLLGLSNQYGYRLPTEAEWEYAARAGTTTDYGFEGGASVLGEYAWYGENAGGHPHVVGQKQPNTFGLYDMHGNIWEWCQDHYHNNYEGAPVDGSAWEDDGEAADRVIRGGSWYHSDIYCRSARRFRGAPGSRSNFVGFRLSRTLPSALLPSGCD
jgi:formylglycine-generating enzyme required for sulfatase activity